MQYKVDWNKPLEWSNGTRCTAIDGDCSDVKKISPKSSEPDGDECVWVQNGCRFLDGPGEYPYVRNVEKEVKDLSMCSRNFSDLEDQDLADALKDIESQLAAVTLELEDRGFEIDGGRYDIPNASSISKTVELDINGRR